MTRVVCAACAKPARDMRYVEGQILCVGCSPATTDNPNHGPRVCWKCREPVDHRSNELLCEPCAWAERSAS